MTWGHDIVAERWAGASNPHLHLNPRHPLKHMQKSFKNACSSTFRLMLTDQQTKGRMDEWTKPLKELRVRN